MPAQKGTAGHMRPTIDLKPGEWGLATWRPVPAPPAEAPRPFDPDAVRAAMKAAHDNFGWWHWRRNPLPAGMTPEEASFWLRATRLDHSLQPEAAAVGALARDDILSADEAFLLAIHTQLPYGEAMSALAAVMEPAEIAERLASPPPPKPSWTVYGRPLEALAAGARVHLVPRLAPADLDRLAEAARQQLRARLQAPDFVVGDAATLGAQLGCHEEVAELTARWPDGWFRDGGGSYATIALGLGSAEAFAAEAQRTRLLPDMPHSIPGWLAQLELAALEPIGRAVAARENRAEAEHFLAVFGTRVHAPAAAPVMLALLRSSRAPAAAYAWLAEHPAETVEGLAPLVGRSPDAADTLRRLARAGVLGEVTDERVRAVIDDPRSRLPVHPPLGWPKRRAPSAAGLPPLVVDGARLAEEDVEAVLAALAVDAPVDGLAVDPDAAEEFAWELFEGWLLAGAPAKEKWRMLALGRFGGDRTALRLVPLIRAWPGEAQHKRAVLGLDVLRAIGTDTALMQLNGIAHKVKYKALQTRARAAIEEIADELGLSRAELEDRIVPDCGLDGDGRRTFDYGPRSFDFVLGPDMKPRIRDESGKLRSAPPKAAARDDADKAAAALADWKLVRKQVADVAKLQALRLERAMISGRVWTVADFERLLVAHPLLRHLVRRLVWTSAAGSFRVTEEGDYADVDDRPLTLDGPVAIPHPLTLAAPLRAAWGEVLADYELVPPFPQLGRPLYDIDEPERSAVELTRFAGARVPALTLVGILERSGWRRGEIEDGGMYRSHWCEFDGVSVVAEYEGVVIGDPTALGDQAVERCYALDRRPWGEIDPVVRCEVLATLTEIAQRA